MTRREYPEIKLCGCDRCSLCSIRYSQNADFHYAQPYGNTGIYDAEENIIYITKCAGKAVFRKIVTMINHEYFHWVIDKIFPDEEYMVVGEYGHEYKCAYSNALDTRFWKGIEKSLGQRICDSDNFRWLPTKVDVWDGMIALPFDRMNMVDVTEWFR